MGMDASDEGTWTPDDDLQWQPAPVGRSEVETAGEPGAGPRPVDPYMDDEMDDYEDGGVNMVDSLIRSLPQLIGSLVVAMIVYSIYKMFTGQVASALGDIIGGLAGVVTEILQNWRIFLIAFLVKIAVVSIGSGLLKMREMFYGKAEHDIKVVELNIKREELLAKKEALKDARSNGASTEATAKSEERTQKQLYAIEKNIADIGGSLEAQVRAVSDFSSLQELSVNYTLYNDQIKDALAKHSWLAPDHALKLLLDPPLDISRLLNDVDGRYTDVIKSGIALRLEMALVDPVRGQIAYRDAMVYAARYSLTDALKGSLSGDQIERLEGGSEATAAEIASETFKELSAPRGAGDFQNIDTSNPSHSNPVTINNPITKPRRPRGKGK
jgi:hypothetical protein